MGKVGDCDWCRAKRIKTVPLGELTETFDGFVEAHTTASSFESGERLGDLLTEWSVFGEVLNNDTQARQGLVVAILEEGLPPDPKDRVDYPDYRDLFTPKWEQLWNLEEVWAFSTLRLVRGEKDPTQSAEWPDVDQVAMAIEELGEEHGGERTLFRARCHREAGRVGRYQLHEMGAPPPEKTSAGRANRAGEPVLYAAMETDTAVAEVRPWKHAAVAVATMKLRRTLRILDLTAPGAHGSPFAGPDLRWRVEARRLLGRFGEELSRPVSPYDETKDYIPSQQICDAVRGARFDGVVYPSSLRDGGKTKAPPRVVTPPLLEAHMPAPPGCGERCCWTTARIDFPLPA